jgi:methanesulfonate monooxygenase subunit beta
MGASDTTLLEPRVRELVGRGCLALDEERFNDWMALCAPEFRYSIVAHSPALRKDMTWLDLDRAGMANLFSTLRTHERDPGALFRQPSILSVVARPDGAVDSVSSVIVIRTAPDGDSALFAAVHYHDRIVHAEGAFLLAEREVRCATRIFRSDSGGSHVPL